MATAQSSAFASTRTRGPKSLALVVGVLLTVVGLALGAVGVALAAMDASTDGGYRYTDSGRLHAAGYAITTVPLPLELGEDDAARAGKFGLEDVVGIQLRATPAVADQRLFIGIAGAHDLRTYLQGVPHSVYRDGLVDHPGARATPARPGDQAFWEHSVIGTGTLNITLNVRPGDWVAVIMNADGSRPVSVDVQAGARTELFGLTNPGALIAGLVGLVLGIPLALLGGVSRQLRSYPRR